MAQYRVVVLRTVREHFLVEAESQEEAEDLEGDLETLREDIVTEDVVYSELFNQAVWDGVQSGHGAEDANGDLINPEDGVGILEKERK